MQLIFGESAFNLVGLPRSDIEMVLQLGNGHLTAEGFVILTKLLDLVPAGGDGRSHAVAAAARALTKVSGKVPKKTNCPGALQAAGTGPGGSSAADDHAALVRSSLKCDKSRFGRMLDRFTSELEHANSVARQVFDAQTSLNKLTREHKCLLEREEFVRGEIARLRTTINR